VTASVVLPGWLWSAELIALGIGLAVCLGLLMVFGGRRG
jgi:hypothetical protein